MDFQERVVSCSVGSRGEVLPTDRGCRESKSPGGRWNRTLGDKSVRVWDENPSRLEGRRGRGSTELQRRRSESWRKRSVGTTVGPLEGVEIPSTVRRSGDLKGEITGTTVRTGDEGTTGCGPFWSNVKGDGLGRE